MTAAGLFADLRQRGVELRRDGQLLRWRAPAGVVSATDLEELRAKKEELLAELDRFARSKSADATIGGPVVESREQIGAVLIKSKRFGEVWIALDRCMVPALAAEEASRPEPRPVLTAADIVIAGKSETAIRSMLEVARVFPGSRVEQ